MSKVAKVLGLGADTSGLRAEQRRQQDLIDASNRRTSLIEAGQRAVNGSAGGFLSFLDDDLKSTFGGG